MDLTPPIPTDNLYKFMALAGLLVLGSSLYYRVRSLDEMVLRTNRYVGETRKYAIETEQMADESKNLAKFAEKRAQRSQEILRLAEQALEDAKAGRSYSKVPNLDKASDAKFEADELRYRKLRFDLKLKEADLESVKDEIEILKDNIKLGGWLIHLANLIGSTLLVSGFALWYYRVQKPMDLLLLKQATSPEMNTGSSLPTESDKDTAKPA